MQPPASLSERLVIDPKQISQAAFGKTGLAAKLNNYVSPDGLNVGEGHLYQLVESEQMLALTSEGQALLDFKQKARDVGQEGIIKDRAEWQRRELTLMSGVFLRLLWQNGNSDEILALEGRVNGKNASLAQLLTSSRQAVLGDTYISSILADWRSAGPISKLRRTIRDLGITTESRNQGELVDVPDLVLLADHIWTSLPQPQLLRFVSLGNALNWPGFQALKTTAELAKETGKTEAQVRAAVNNLSGGHNQGYIRVIRDFGKRSVKVVPESLMLALVAALEKTPLDPVYERVRDMTEEQLRKSCQLVRQKVEIERTEREEALADLGGEEEDALSLMGYTRYLLDFEEELVLGRLVEIGRQAGKLVFAGEDKRETWLRMKDEAANYWERIGLKQHSQEQGDVPEEIMNEVLIENIAWAVEAQDLMDACNFRLVVSVAQDYLDRGLDFLDLIQEGEMGLLATIRDNYRWQTGAKFSTYATQGIKMAIQKAIGLHGSLIRHPAGYLEEMRQLEHTITYLGDQGQSVTPENIARHLDIPRATASRMLAQRPTYQPPDRMERPLRGKGDGKTLGDRIASLVGNPESEVDVTLGRKPLTELMNRLQAILESDQFLTEREKATLRNRLSDEPQTLEAMAREWGVTRERVRQIEYSAMKKVREIFEVEKSYQRKRPNR